jgi:hypothetical protein
MIKYEGIEKADLSFYGQAVVECLTGSWTIFRGLSGDIRAIRSHVPSHWDRKLYSIPVQTF